MKKSLTFHTESSEIEGRAPYREAASFAQSIEPRDGVDYQWIWDYSKEHYEMLCKVRSILDDKANDILKYLGSGTALFTLGVLANIKSENWYLYLLAIPSYFLSLLSLYYAIKAREPSAAFHPPAIKGLWDYFEHYQKKEKAPGHSSDSGTRRV